MRMEEITQQAIALIKAKGEEGAGSTWLAEELGVHKRRIYDLISVLRPLGIIETRKENNVTKVIWRGIDNAVVANETQDNKESKNGQTTIQAKKIKILPKGAITRISNKGVELVVETNKPGIKIEALNG